MRPISRVLYAEVFYETTKKLGGGTPNLITEQLQGKKGEKVRRFIGRCARRLLFHRTTRNDTIRITYGIRDYVLGGRQKK